MSIADPASIFDLTGRTAVVTGASSGIGARAALVLAAAGATVVAGARRGDRLAELAEQHDRVVPVVADVGTPEGRASLLGAAGRVDVLVNNAATGGQVSTDTEDAADFARVLDLNLVAAYDLARAVASQDGPSGPVSIVNVASVLGMVSAAPLAGAGYAASKAGLIGLTRELAGQWAGRGVRVNALAPGWIRTEMTEALLSDERSARWVERGTMLRRPGAVEELDGALLFLASEASSYCTGQVLVVDGGWTAR